VIAYLMTRGTPRRLDYRFIGAAPPVRWWAPLGAWLVLERAEVVVHSGPGGPAVLVSGIPSARRDSVTTAIRYTLVVDGPAPALLLGLVAAGLDDSGRAALGAALDAEFPADWVDAVLAGDGQADEEASARLGRVLDSVAVGGPPPTTPSPESWAGAAGDADAVAAFLARVGQLGTGATGWAFTTAGLSSVEGARRAAEQLGAPVAVLLGSGGPPAVADLAAAVPKKAVDRGKAVAGQRAGQQRSRVVVVGVVAALVVVAVTLLLLLLI
jgi:hypothetical protein